MKSVRSQNTIKARSKHYFCLVFKQALNISAALVPCCTIKQSNFAMSLALILTVGYTELGRRALGFHSNLKFKHCLPNLAECEAYLHSNQMVQVFCRLQTSYV